MSKTKHEHTTTKASNVRVGDKVKIEGVAAFVVAGIRANPVNGDVRLFDDTSALRVELEPGYAVEVER